jgi:hypothetical protein
LNAAQQFLPVICGVIEDGVRQNVVNNREWLAACVVCTGICEPLSIWPVVVQSSDARSSDSLNLATTLSRANQQADLGRSD